MHQVWCNDEVAELRLAIIRNSDQGLSLMRYEHLNNPKGV